MFKDNIITCLSCGVVTHAKRYSTKQSTLEKLEGFKLKVKVNKNIFLKTGFMVTSYLQ